MRGGGRGVSVELLPVRGGRAKRSCGGVVCAWRTAKRSAELLPVCGGRQSAPTELLPVREGRLDRAVRSFGW